MDNFVNSILAEKAQNPTKTSRNWKQSTYIEVFKGHLNLRC
jgi:hypothetical protein